MPQNIRHSGAIRSGSIKEVFRNRGKPGQEEHGVISEAPPPFHDRDREEGELGIDQPLRLAANVVDTEDVDEDVVDRSNVVVIEPDPEDENKGAGIIEGMSNTIR